MIHGLLDSIQSHPVIRRFLREMQGGIPVSDDEPLSLHLLSAARPAFVAALADTIRRPLVLLVARPEQGLQMFEELRRWLPEPERVSHFPEPGALPYERAPWSTERAQKRIAVLTELSAADKATIVVTPVQAVLQPTVPADLFRELTRMYTIGQTISLQFALASWYAMGYQNTSTVVGPGQFARRGGILDVFPMNAQHPARIELWGDEIDSLRVFDPVSQRSIEAVSEIVVPPASEAILHRRAERAAERLRTLATDNLTEVVHDELHDDIGRLMSGQRFPELEFYIPYLYDQTGMLFDYLPDDALVLVDDWETLEVVVADAERQALDMREERIMRGELPADFADALHTWDDLRDHFTSYPPLVLGYGTPESPYGVSDVFAAGTRFGGRLSEAMEAVRQAVGTKTQVIVSRQAERLRELLADEGITVTPRERVPTEPAPGNLNLVDGALNEGFVLRADGAVQSDAGAVLEIITDAELFGWSRAVPRRPMRPRRRRSAEDIFEEISPGDYVVHVEHGIGVYRGLIQREINHVTREYLEIEYANDDRLFVPVHKADRVARYIGPEGSEPRIHRLGTADWETARRNAKRAVDEIAEDLLELYAARENAEGYAFSPDTDWQAELEASFPYEETEDQRQAIEEVKTDMEQPRPMDRLVCGDVGFGKTEVAVRAAFKAVMDSKQVAMLVPTTVLAQQHYNTFRRRLAKFPVEVEMLSRFRSQTEQAEIVERLADGTIDIIIGTHRLLSQDVAFKDLGLVIIDEEQRFGVTHKEHLKQLRTTVDVLTLTATPIPRTLHMSLTGVRDLSRIDTPPQERLPVITRVLKWDDDEIRRAILQEMDRGGQVFFVHNRVMTIQAMAQRVQALVPEANIVVAHGQMNENELEQAMLEFSEGEHDVLVCTSIIENGLDLPNVNTIIVHHAEQFGLAQLYQLRGRVGRGARRGYAYFVHPKKSSLTYEAVERLNTMREATELGAGFRIAIKDLQIRGAGDLLGARQSGHIAAVGFDMYTKLLAKAVQEKRAERDDVASVELDEVFDDGPPIDLPLQAYIPESYVPADEDRLRIYRRMAAARTVEDATDIENELRDRFGELPEPVENLIFVLRARALARTAGVKAVQRDTGDVVVKFPGPAETRRLVEAGVFAERGDYGRRDFRLPLDGGPRTWKAELEEALQAFAAFAREQRELVTAGGI